jgi:geranylgeranyl diphosphate synthase, type II
MGTPELTAYLDSCKGLIFDELQRIVPRGPLSDILYDRMLDYPRRSAKALRPALCIATCRALGGGLEAALPTAAVLELYHNAFLVHDDIEDGSELRRDAPTLHTTFGVPIAINIGDAMLALALTPLLENTRTIGLGKALRVLRIVAEMARVSAEGQALELEWIRASRFDLTDEDYVEMVARKTSHYSFVTPLLAGAVLAGLRDEEAEALRLLGRELGIAFQIQDDVLNLTEEYGKERDGDLYEGKRTLILSHLLRSADPDERRVISTILAKPRGPGSGGASSPIEVVREVVAAHAADISPVISMALERACDAAESSLTGSSKTDEDISVLKALVKRHGSIEHAQAVASRWARSAAARFEEVAPRLRPSVEADFLRDLVSYVVERSR